MGLDSNILYSTSESLSIQLHMMEQNATEALLQRVGGEELFRWHRTVGLGMGSLEYAIRYKRILSEGLASTRKIYLDTNYWIWLRDAHLGRGTKEAANLLYLLRKLVNSRKAICVSHHTSFSELRGKKETA